MSFDLILPFLRPIAHLIEDTDISEIMVNGSRRVFVEQHGRVREVTDVRLDERNLRVAIKNIARALGDDISEEKPILDSRLPDGSRVAAVLPPCSLGGTTLTIRKFQTRFFTADELVRIGTLTPEVLTTVRAAIAKNENILISGGTSTGKTTLLNALAAFLPVDDRVVLIEDTAELHIDRPNLVRFEARREQASLPAVTIRELLRATLRHRPDRIIVGEVRGGEAFDLLQALNTGHAGSLSTIHANSAEQALARFASCVVQSGIELPYQAVRYQIADAIDLVLHLERRRGQRVVEELITVGRYEPGGIGTTPSRFIAVRKAREIAFVLVGSHNVVPAPDCGAEAWARRRRACAGRYRRSAQPDRQGPRQRRTNEFTLERGRHRGDDWAAEPPLPRVRHLGAVWARCAGDDYALRLDLGGRGRVRC